VGNPTASKKPPTSQKWAMHNREGGGAVIPCTWKLIVSDTDDTDRVQQRIQATLKRMENTGLSIERIEVNAASYKLY